MLDLKNGDKVFNTARNRTGIAIPWTKSEDEGIFDLFLMDGTPSVISLEASLALISRKATRNQ